MPNVKAAEAGRQAPVSAPTPTSSSSKKELVVASMLGDDTSWLHENLLDWRKNVYVVDDPKADLTVVKNKGRESMVYLTYAPSLGFKKSALETLTTVVTLLTTMTIYRTTCFLYTRSDTNGTTMTPTTTASP